ncbi:MAG: hypothetical protein V4548_10400 [Bacteroidota bacterium]
MKNLIFLCFVILTLSSCDKDDHKTINPIDLLPPATQTGANKVGCLLDGKAFIPSHYNNATNCFYQFVDGDYYFVMAFGNEDDSFNLTDLGVGTRKKPIQEGETYDLYELNDGNTYGAYTYNGFMPSYTSHTHTGKLTITKLDRINYIVSGTFWYDVEDTYGVVHHITDGRFDFHYTN